MPAAELLGAGVWRPGPRGPIYSNNNKSKNSTKSNSGSSMGNSDEALLNEFADIVGLDGMKYLASFFTLVTEEERLSQDYLE